MKNQWKYIRYCSYVDPPNSLDSFDVIFSL